MAKCVGLSKPVVALVFLSAMLTGCQSMNTGEEGRGGLFGTGFAAGLDDFLSERPFFDGATLDGWSQSVDGSWRVEEGDEGGMIVSDSDADTLLISQGRYGDFRLSLEFHVGSFVNSGVLIRCTSPEKISPIECYELNIWDDHDNQDFRTGAIVTHKSPSVRVNTAGRWSRMDIHAEGDLIRVSINGVETASLIDDTHREGHIALQRFKDGKAQFRKIKLEPIGMSWWDSFRTTLFPGSS
ncbi:MAG: DUF1080 domain-containing protein [Ectothiorhodospiraceae bacterium AqS1]|nr:DUF1080 domain-containing protein [Ectothiorhodospiraceae bacterium AqS1]